MNMVMIVFLVMDEVCRNKIYTFPPGISGEIHNLFSMNLSGMSFIDGMAFISLFNKWKVHCSGFSTQNNL